MQITATTDYEEMGFGRSEYGGADSLNLQHQPSYQDLLDGVDDEESHPPPLNWGGLVREQSFR